MTNTGSAPIYCVLIPIVRTHGRSPATIGGACLLGSADETLRRLELAPQIEHPGESGRAREQMLIAFIEQLIPSSLGCRPGS
jgi:hypothetical protein